MKLYDLKTDYRKNPIGIQNPAPRFGWKIADERRGVKQISYQIRAYSNDSLLYDSGVVISDENRHVRYAGAALQSYQRVNWTVAVTAEAADGSRETAESSEDAYFEMGILDPAEWKAKWIEPEDESTDPDSYQPSPCMRRVFSVREGLRRARIYQSAHGLYEFWINGKKRTEDVFKPGFTAYYERLQYQVYDITELLSDGSNVWSVELGDGWWRGISGGTFRNNFGYKLQYIGQILLEYEDGSSELVCTDESFKTSTGGLLMSDPKAGDIYDANLEPEGWREAGFDDSKWMPVHLANPKGEEPYTSPEKLIASESVPVREMERFLPEVLTDANGDTVLDYGQNIAGYVKMRLHDLTPGQKISLSHGEDMKDGAFSQSNICMNLMGEDHLQQIDYIASGREKGEVYCPMFSIFGFRYVRVIGLGRPAVPEDFEAVAVYSACEETGDFTCSNELINKLVSNSRWSQKGNFLDVPTDCPTRERSPWSGDSQVYAKTSTWFMNVYPFFEKWMYDLKLEQMKDGKVANTFPSTNTMHFNTEIARRARIAAENGADEQTIALMGNMETGNIIDGSAGWGDTAVITPYTMYLCYGDREILERQYDSAKAWVSFLEKLAKNPSPDPKRLDEPEYQNFTDGICDADYIVDSGFHWGEWMEPDKPFDPSFLQEALMHPDPEVPTAFFCYSSRLLGEMAEILGKEEDARYYKELSHRVKVMYQKYILGNTGAIKAGRQAPNVRALAFDLIPNEQRPLFAEKLNEMVKAADYHLNTGFLATPFILKELADNGYSETAFRLLEQTTSPGWLYPVTRGATTILENWNAMDTHVYSYNHYSYGAVCDFLFGNIAGIQPLAEAPGYSEFILAPKTGGSLTNASAEYQSLYGPIRSSWEKTEDAVNYHFEIPANTRARVFLQSKEGTLSYSIGSGVYDYSIKE